MDSDNHPHPIVLKHAFDRGTRGDALRNPETRAIVPDLWCLNPLALESDYYLESRHQVWIAVIVAAVMVIALWLDHL